MGGKSRHGSAVEGIRRLCAILSPFTGREALLADWPPPALWPAIVAQADAHRLLPALAVALERHGLCGRIDEELVDLLAAVAEWNMERNEGLRRQVLALSEAFNAAGRRPVWLKGALSLLPADGPAGGRMMLDLDMWLPAESDQQAALRVMESLGYAATEDEWWDSRRHYPPYFHPGEIARLELHRRVVDREHEALLPPEEAAAGVEWLEWEGTRIGRLDALSRLLCSFAQCTRPECDMLQVADVPLMKALDFVARAHDDFGGSVPPAFVERVTAAGWEKAARRFLTLTELYFGLPNPLAPDLGQVRMVERRAARPRWHVALRALQSLVGPGGRALLRHPRRIPTVLANSAARLVAPSRPPAL